MKELSVNEVAVVSGGFEASNGIGDSITGAIVDGTLGTFYGALVGGANAGAAGSGGVLGVGIIAQGVGAIAGGVLGAATGAVLGAATGYSHSDDYITGTLGSIWSGSGLPKKGLA